MSARPSLEDEQRAVGTTSSLTLRGQVVTDTAVDRAVTPGRGEHRTTGWRHEER